jgi:hypothetical protein
MQAKNVKEKTQSSLDGMVEKLQGPREFTRESVLHAVTQFVACNDQVSFANRVLSLGAKRVRRVVTVTV